MTKKEFKKLKPGDVVLVKYIDELLPTAEIVVSGVTKERNYVDFESGNWWNLIDQAPSLGVLLKIGRVERNFVAA